MKNDLLYKDHVLRWLEIILRERFGYDFKLTQANNRTIKMYLNDLPGNIDITINPDFFLCSSSNLAYTIWNPEPEGWKSILGKPLPTPGTESLRKPLIEKLNSNHIIHYDILGLTYWMLSRLEEINRTDLDIHGRFPATSSHAFKYGYIERAIVDEWLDILKQVIIKQWSNLELKQHHFTMIVSHDVDLPSRYAFCSLWSLLNLITEDVLTFHTPTTIVKALWIRLRSSKGLHPSDPYNTFEWIMDLSEKNNLCSAFYFLTGRTEPSKDTDYEIDHPAIRKLIRSIHERGHEIGLHPSYNTYNQPNILKDEAERLIQVCKQEGVKQDTWGGRMHYLRWAQPNTLQALEHAGISYDSTLGYADSPGFRCGTCYEYPAIDPIKESILNLRIRPLIAMESSVFSTKYMGLSEKDALEKLIQLKNTCRKMEGQYTLLWHNSFMEFEKRKVYESVLRA